MPQFTHDFPHRLVAVVTNAFSTFLLVVIFCILQYTFDMEFVCSCRPGLHPNGVIYIFLPPLILTWFVMVTEPIHQKRIFSKWYHRGNNNWCFSSLKLFFDYFGLLVVWFAMVLCDGDWFFCLKTNLNASQTGIPCKSQTNLTYEEYRIKAEYKTASLDYGLIAISSLLALWIIEELIRVCCTRSKRCKSCCWSKHPYYKVVYKDLLEDQVINHLNDELSKIAKERAEAICKPQLETIRKNELRLNNDGEVNDDDQTPLETWWNISASDFYLEEPERQEDSWVHCLA